MFDSDIITANDKYPFEYKPHPTNKGEFSIAILTHIKGNEIDSIINDDQNGNKLNAILSNSVNDEISLAYVEHPCEYEEFPDIDRGGLYSSAIYQKKGESIYDCLNHYKKSNPLPNISKKWPKVSLQKSNDLLFSIDANSVLFSSLSCSIFSKSIDIYGK